jgi:tetratricopeptide (TPR) repeat protein/CHAT domain-containing protein
MPAMPTHSNTTVDPPAFRLHCERCGTPATIDDPDLIFRFPQDAQAIVDLIQGTLGLRNCEVCENAAVVPLPLVFVDVLQRRVVVAQIEQAFAEQLAREGGFDPSTELVVCNDMNGLRAFVADRAREYLIEAVRELRSGECKPIDALHVHDSQLLLLLLALMLDGEIDFEIHSELPLPQEQLRADLGAVVDLAVIRVVRQLYTWTFHNGGIHTYLDVIRNRLPPRCIRTDVLAELAAECERPSHDLLADPTTLDRRFRAELIHACIYSLLNRPNPRVRDWAGLMGYIFLLNERGDVVLPKLFLLTPELLNATVPIEVFWDVVVLPFVKALTDSRDHAVLGPLLQRISEGFGWKDRVVDELRHGAFKLRFAPTDLVPQSIVDAIFAASAKAAGSGDDGSQIALAIEHFCMSAMQQERDVEAVQVLELALDRAAAAGPDSLAYMSQTAIKVMNVFGKPRDALRLWYRHSEALAEYLAASPPYLPMMLFNEIGNSYRYLGDSEGALQAYALCAERIPGLENAAQYWLVLRRNVAIVLREAGRFEEALAVLEELEAECSAARDPARAHVLHSKALVYTAAHQYQAAWSIYDEACRIRIRDECALSTGLWLGRAMTGVHLPSKDTAADLKRAVAAAGSSRPFREYVACGILEASRHTTLPAELVALAVRRLEESLPIVDTQGALSIRLSSAVALVNWRLRNGDQQGALQLALEHLVEDAEGPTYPWQAFVALAACIPEGRSDDRFAALRTALDRMSHEIPQGSGIDMLTSWLQEKEDFQHALRRATEAVIGRHSTKALDLLAVAAFQTASEIRGGHGARSTIEVEGDAGAGELVDVLPEGSAVVVMLDLEKTIRGIVIDAEHAHGSLLSHVIDRQTFEADVREFLRRVPRTVPGRSESLESLLAEPLSQIGTLIAPVVARHDHICFVPSSATLGVPLHACRLANGELALEKCGISIAPNTATLRHCLGMERCDAKGAVVVVSKEGDPAAFVDRAEKFARETAVAMNASPPLVGTEATKSAVLNLLDTSDILLILAHGVDSGPGRGFGIALAARDQLPPALLPVEQAPRLRDFVLDFTDMLPLENAPSLVLSLACSSGRSVAGSGGVRSGLEKSLFRRGCRTIVAPLWDADQESAICFLANCLKYLEERNAPSLAYRKACASVREQFADTFRWAPFVINGAWQGV